MKDNRITTAKNRVFTSGYFSVGANNPISLKTDNKYAYRTTGLSQIEDIIECGYVRPKLGKLKGGHINEVFWSKGNEKLFYCDKRPVLEVLIDKIYDGKIGALSIYDLSAIYIFDEDKNKYIDKKDFYIKQYEIKKLKNLKSVIINNTEVEKSKTK